MTLHPLIELANSREAKQAAAFRAAAAGLSGEALAERYAVEVRNAPRRAAAQKKYLGVRTGRVPTARRTGRDAEHLSIALVNHCTSGRAGLALPEDQGVLDLLDSQVPLATGAASKSAGDADPDKGVGKIAALGVAPSDRLAIVELRYLDPDARRVGTGDTPLRVLLEGLARCAIASANYEALQAELTEGFDRLVEDEPPALFVVGSPRYWELCRKREAQKGAAWIREVERLGREIEEAIGVTVGFLALELGGDPPWSYGDGTVALTGEPKLAPAWEASAGRVRPKPRPKPKREAAAHELVVEPDFSRPPRPYAPTDTYSAGDRIEHHTLGTGVVQGESGHRKIRVLFDGKPSLLVHARPAARS